MSLEIVDYSKLPMDGQTWLLGRLLRIISQTPEFGQAQSGDQLIGLPSADGMTLVFFGDPVAPVRCASEVARSLQSHPELKLRMGIHSGPVYRVAGLDSRANVAGEGIKTAQRIMSRGDAGHILLSKPVADTLGHLGNWAKCLHELGECEVNPGTRVQLFNLYTGEIGNPDRPCEFLATPPSTTAPAAPVAERAALSPTEAAVPVAEPAITRKVRPVLVIALAAAIAAAIASYLVFNRAPSTPPLLAAEFTEDFRNLHRWTFPSTGWNIVDKQQCLQIENQSELGFLNKVNCDDFTMGFHVKLLNAAGVAWAVRVKDPKNYYLFYLSGPEGQVTNRFLFYIVREDKPFIPTGYDFTLTFPIQLKAYEEYDIELIAKENQFTITIEPRETGKKINLGVFKDTGNTYPAGGIGFRTVGVEKVCVSDLYVRPPGVKPAE